MIRLVWQKTVQLLLVFLLMSVLAFTATRVMPGDPIELMYGNKDVSADVIAKARSLYHLDKPLGEQYYIYINDLLHGDLGFSYFYVGKPVAAVIARGFKNTVLIALLAFPLAAVLGLLLGCLAAYYQGRPPDNIINAVTAFFTAIPDVPLAIFLVFILGVKLQLLPIAGWGGARYLVLPILFIILWPALSLAKLVRALILEEAVKPYVYMARARGLSRWAVIRREILPNTMLMISTSLGIILGHMLEGTLIAELVFNIPGFGRIAVESIFRRDYPVIMGIIFLVTLIYTTINYVVDILHLYLDPRVRESDGDF